MSAAVSAIAMTASKTSRPTVGGPIGSSPSAMFTTWESREAGPHDDERPPDPGRCIGPAVSDPADGGEGQVDGHEVARPGHRLGSHGEIGEEARDDNETDRVADRGKRVEEEQPAEHVIHPSRRDRDDAAVTIDGHDLAVAQPIRRVAGRHDRWDAVLASDDGRM